MLQTDPHSALGRDKMSAGGHCPASLPPAPPTSKRRKTGSSQGVGIPLVEIVLPKARDRLVTIGENAPLTEAAELLFEPSCRMVVVCDPANVMMGVITRTDIIRKIRRCQGCACATPCMMTMTRQVIACRPNDRLADMWAVMKDKQLRSIPVIDPRRRPIGLLSARDALDTLLAAVEYEGSLLRDYVMGVGYR